MPRRLPTKNSTSETKLVIVANAGAENITRVDSEEKEPGRPPAMDALS